MHQSSIQCNSTHDNDKCCLDTSSHKALGELMRLNQEKTIDHCVFAYPRLREDVLLTSEDKKIITTSDLHKKTKAWKSRGFWMTFQNHQPTLLYSAIFLFWHPPSFFFNFLLKCNQKTDVEWETSKACQLEGNWLHTLWWSMGLKVCTVTWLNHEGNVVWARK